MHHRSAQPPLRENRAAVGNATGYNEDARSRSAPPAVAEHPIQTTQFRRAYVQALAAGGSRRHRREQSRHCPRRGSLR